MKPKQGSKVIECIIGVLMSIFFITVALNLFKADLTSTIFGAIKDSSLPPSKTEPSPLNPVEVPAPQPVVRADQSDYKHYTDKNGDEVIIIPARYQANTEAAPILAAPQKRAPQDTPLASQPVPPARVAPLQAAPPVNLTQIAMKAAANAHSGMNVFESCRCNNGLATKDDLKQEVLEKCAQPASRQFTASLDCREIWLYNFGPNEFMQGVCFRGDRVTKVLSLDHGY